MKMAAPAVTPPIATQAQGRMWAAPFLWASSPDPTLGNESPCSPHIEVLFGMRKTGLLLQVPATKEIKMGSSPPAPVSSFSSGSV